jgi:DNA-directed RNA polymerase specialized sigma24 family protein
MVTQAQQDDDLDLQVRIGLLGTADEREEAVRLLFARFARPVMSFLADRFGDLDSDERASVVHDAFRALYQMATNGQLDPDKPVAGLLFTVAKRRAIDARRKNSRRIRADVNLNEEVGAYLLGTETGRDWSLALALGKAAEVGDEFRQFVPTLKGQQRRVASVMADSLPDWLSDHEIAQEVFERTHEHITAMEVKGAKNALMAKFRTILKRKLM